MNATQGKRAILAALKEAGKAGVPREIFEAGRTTVYGRCYIRRLQELESEDGWLINKLNAEGRICGRNEDIKRWVLVGKRAPRGTALKDGKIPGTERLKIKTATFELYELTPDGQINL